MLILSIHHGAHDMTAAVADDYQILSAVQAERITRLKGEGHAEYEKKAMINDQKWSIIK